MNTNLVNLFSEAIMGVTADQSGYYFALIRHLFKVILYLSYGEASIVVCYSSV